MAPSLYGPGQGPYNGPLPHIYPNLYATNGPIYDPRVHGMCLFVFQGAISPIMLSAPKAPAAILSFIE